MSCGLTSVVTSWTGSKWILSGNVSWRFVSITPFSACWFVSCERRCGKFNEDELRWLQLYIDVLICWNCTRVVSKRCVYDANCVSITSWREESYIREECVHWDDDLDCGVGAHSNWSTIIGYCEWRTEVIIYERWGVKRRYDNLM